MGKAAKDLEMKYQERVVPGPFTFLVVGALLPAVTVVLEPFSLQLGLVVGSLLTAAAWFLIWFMSPIIEVRGNELRVGIARIPLSALGASQVIEPSEIFQERGPRLDVRAFTSFQGTVKSALKIEVIDASDPTPYWLISTRKPADLKRALEIKPSSGQIIRN